MKLFALVEGTDHVCCRYRLRAFLPALHAAGHDVAIEALARGAVVRLLQFMRASRHDAVLLQRRLLPAVQRRCLRRATKRLIYDFDDALFHRDSYHPRGVFDPVRERRFAALVSAADMVIAGNALLAKQAVERGAAPRSVAVIPTCVEPVLYPLAQHGPRPDGLTLVWIGSSSTLQGLERDREMFHRIGLACPGVRLKVICNTSPDLGALPVVAVPWREASEGGDLASCDAGIGWIPDDPWSAGKCGLKILQYQAAGLPVIANPVGVQKDMVQTGTTGFLAASVDEFVSAIRKLSADAGLRALMGRAARERVEREFSIKAWERSFLNVVTGA